MLEAVGKECGDPLVVVGVDEVTGEAPDALVGLIAQEPGERGAGLRDRALCIVQDDRIRTLFDERPKPPLALREGIFPVLALSDVPDDLGKAAQRPRITPQGGRAARCPQSAAVAPDQPILILALSCGPGPPDLPVRLSLGHLLTREEH